MPNSLDNHSTDTLRSMQSQLMKWIIGLLVVDGLIVAAFVLLLVMRPRTNVLPLVPVLLIPGLVLAPFLLRLTSIKKELARRGA
ncbi:MAG: hypothetical protein IBJ03_08500 [Gemmatimonadaceae bacterium]|nr:hypothetical protein [Gemmatimonadaceae bacterium]